MIGKESIVYSLRNLRKRRARSLFTIFSIMAGITTIFIFISFGLGLYNYIENMSSGSSADKLIIQPKGMGPLDPTFSFSEDDLRAVQRAPGVYDATGIYFKIVETKQNKNLKYTYLMAYDPQKPFLFDLYNGVEMSEGRELKTGDTGVVAGSDYAIAEKIFSRPYSLNQNLEVQGRGLKIIGFLGSVGNPQDDAQIYSTVDTLKNLFPGENLSYNWIIAKVDKSNIKAVAENVERNLRNERNIEKGKENFYAQSFDDMIESYSMILDIVIGFILLIALISVLVSSVNTANTMITSVLERTKEIGVIKSIGGTNSEIFGIFLFESSFLGFIAGALGVFFGWLLSSIGGQILASLGYSFLAPYFPAGLFLGCIGFAILTGAVSGVIPAMKASKTNPVETLRYE